MPRLYQEHRDILEKIGKDGFVRVRIDGQIQLLEEVRPLAKTIRHDIDAVVDRLRGYVQDDCNFFVGQLLISVHQKGFPDVFGHVV